MLAKLKLAFMVLIPALSLTALSGADARTTGKRLANTTWVGTETVTDRPTKLAFAFRADGACLRTDDASPGRVKGTWRQQTDSVIVTFDDCVYTGRIDGDRLRGFAQGADGRWSFDVTFGPCTPKRDR